ncbi:hypothetical protein [Nocardia neocaledoniensis]|uniref:DoxX-like protein n=1 Tax=Nocardia neocaledoniensis TaxID=236511 RepID=A0A317NN95_9NOCA|nr:hypothetical protein [Nocardia neocaledoniensis]PWV75984.1 hypothetical protein DFR69_10485 [Nocardia neocaledoniensis]
MHAIAAIALGGFLIAIGVSHFLAPAYYRSLVPAALPRPDLLVAASGVVEIAIGAATIVPMTRTFGIWMALALLSSYLVLWVARLFRAGADRGATAAAVGVNAAYVTWAAVLVSTGS